MGQKAKLETETNHPEKLRIRDKRPQKKEVILLDTNVKREISDSLL